ncbi:MAG: hypothetical protein Dasosvirus8_9 [Dasosvirus sp.]|uniref:Uncharacterized protein n=1 Tax=Dasosvirus sp. TaxID=2487764 RepID=A0A3G4ZRT2_9VIRU|nr:MAG: hypothetical protein Dasosvirus8_9 [Dasosvirus sp.]
MYSCPTQHIIIVICGFLIVFWLVQICWDNKNSTIEKLVITDSTYSQCATDCLVACQKCDPDPCDLEKCQVYIPCYNECRKICWRF